MTVPPDGSSGSSSASTQGPSTPAITLPKGGGAIRGIGEKFAANPVTGTGSFSVPISTSPGRSGFGPQLALMYDSGAGNGPFGFGWSLGVPQITRKTDKGLPLYQDEAESDVFLLSGAEDLVPVLQEDGTRQDDTLTAPGYVIRRYRPRIEGLFARIERWTQQSDDEIHWRSISSSNIQSLYGLTPASRIADPEDPRRTFTWLLSETRDCLGNVVLYDYKAEDGTGVDLNSAHERHRGAVNDPRRTANRYLKRIRYGNRTPLLDTSGRRPRFLTELPPAQLAATEWLFEVVLDYGEHDLIVPRPADAGPWVLRADAFSSYRSGFEVRTNRCCRRVLMFHHFPAEVDVGANCLVKATEFEYSSDADPLSADNPVYSFLQGVTHASFRREGAGYLRKTLPPVEFEYSRPVVQERVEEIDPDSLTNLPVGVDGLNYQWTDLHGEGIPGILSEQADAWTYKRNLSPLGRRAVEFALLERVMLKPNLALVGGAQFMDLAGDGLPDLVTLDDPLAGLYEHDEAEGWQGFRPFASRLNVDFHDANLRMVDLNGDGHADVLITGDDALIWHPSLGEAGFGPARRVALSLDESQGPRVVFNDTTGLISLADLSGDGLNDLVRVRNGEVSYWPNLGYGKFGAKVTMDNAPWFDFPDGFDHKRLRLADIDGSGTTDLIYLHQDGVRLYFNQSGNSWSVPKSLRVFPRVDDLASVVPADLLGNGTACLVWSSSLPGDAARPMRYLNLMGGQKPHLLISSANNLGAETRVTYVPSTKFYLQDKQAGRPWLTRLPFPVHVVERVETVDHLSHNRFISRSAYHHGYFDPLEREFRGFGMVEQWDTEEIGALTPDGTLLSASNLDPAFNVPPVHTKTWFHTGFWQQGARISHGYAHEYYGAPSRQHQDTEPAMGVFEKTLLPDTVQPDGLSLDEAREACRALKGSMLRQEVYADDAPPGSSAAAIQRAATPYTVSEQNFTVRLLQSRAGNRHAVFLTHAREVVTAHLERDPSDPRLQHALTLEVDEYGNVLRQIAIGYGRLQPDMSLPAQADRDVQTRTLITATEARVTNAIDEPSTHPDDHRTPTSCETATFELTGFAPETGAARFSFAEWARNNFALTETAAALSYETVADGVTRQRRMIELTRTVGRKDDLSALLPLGRLEPLALQGESYKLAFTPGLLTDVYQRDGQPLLQDLNTVLGGCEADQGGYVQSQTLQADGRFLASDLDDHWWVPSGRVYFSPVSGDSPLTELSYAQHHFFLPHRARNPFHTAAAPTENNLSYDTYDLLVTETRDALGNRVTVGERRPDGTLDPARSGHDYRLLQPWRVMDPNRNRSQVAFDTLGQVVGTAVLGKPEETLGDSLDGFVADLPESLLLAHLLSPLTDPHVLLGHATTRLIYDLQAYRRSRLSSAPQPTVVYRLSRETHDSDLAPGQLTKVQHRFSYMDGFGRDLQEKRQAQPGSIPKRGPDGQVLTELNGQLQFTADSVAPRWVASGWKVVNNKGRPVRQYEPFFTDTHHFEFDQRLGVSAILFYDPLDRAVVTLHPNHTYEKIVFSPWQQMVWDVNDTVLDDPRLDTDISGFTSKYFSALLAGPPIPVSPWETWATLRLGGELGTLELASATKALAHARTPTTLKFDSLARPFMTVVDNGLDLAHPGQHLLFTDRVVLDLQGHHLVARDSIVQAGDELGRAVMQYSYDLLGHRLSQSSMEAGTRWTLNDVTSQPLRAWDSRGHQFRNSYDLLRRPTDAYLSTAGGFDQLVGRTVYGEASLNAETTNLLGKVAQVSDQAGLVISDRYDFKGNPLKSRRSFATDYSHTLDWSRAVPLETETFTGHTCFDALNRPQQVIAPHSDLSGTLMNISSSRYNEANLLRQISVWLNQTTEPTGLLDPDGATLQAILNIDYDARGQRQQIEYGNGVITVYQYDPLTFRLTRLTTTRTMDHAVLQDLYYTFDPVGNLTHIRDDAQQTLFFNNRRVEPSTDFTYDALYRLVEAHGREHLGQSGGPPIPYSYNDVPRVGLAHRNDGQAMGTYSERYVYDPAGNLRTMSHQGTDPAQPGWSRNYFFDEPSQLEAAKRSNRLSRTTLSDGLLTTESYSFDAHGNMQHMPHLQVMEWDFRDQLRTSQRQKVNAADLAGIEHQGERTYYVYDAAGARARKVTELSTGQVKDERIYLGGYEMYRQRGIAPLRRESMHLMDGTLRFAVIDTRTDLPGALPSVRYQFSTHLGSACLELDRNAEIISYEEYTPFGSTSYQAGRTIAEVSLKRYRYTGMERDDETGLSYHGARYYAPWLGRWTSCDPAGLIDGPNLFQYARDNPVVLNDPSGRDPPNPANYATLESYFEASPKVYSQEYLQTVWESVNGPMTPAVPRTLNYSVARSQANAGARAFRVQEGMVGNGAVVQAGHTVAARHVPESGISRAAANAPETFMPLTSQHGYGMSVDVSGQATPLTPHNAQELVINACVDNARTGNGGVLTPEAHQASGAEVRWRLQGTGFDQREADLKRAGGLFDEAAAIENSSAVQARRAAMASQATPLQSEASLAASGTSMVSKGAGWALFGLNLYFALRGAKQDHEQGDTLGTVLNLSTIGPQAVVTGPLTSYYEGMKAGAELLKMQVDCSAIGLGYEMGDISVDDRRLHSCMPLLSDQIQKDVNREYFSGF